MSQVEKSLCRLVEELEVAADKLEHAPNPVTAAHDVMAKVFAAWFEFVTEYAYHKEGRL